MATLTRRLQRSRRLAGGFTLIELLIVMAIVGVFAAFAAPTMGGYLKAQRVKSTVYEIYSALLYARSEAIKRRGDVVLTPATSDWAGGWTISTGGTAIKTQDAFKAITVTMSPTAATLTYRSDGRISGTSPSIAVDVGDSAVKARCITIDISGSPRSRDMVSGGACP